jgi:hypothetical protein
MGLIEGFKINRIPLVIERESPKTYNITELISESGKDLNRLKSYPERQITLSEDIKINQP